MSQRTTNAGSGRFVSRRIPFHNGHGSLYGEAGGSGDTERYVVYSYGSHFPIYAYSGGRWWGNSDKYSRTTTAHQNHARPSGEVIRWVDTRTMCDIAYCGVVGAIQRKFLEATAA